MIDTLDEIDKMPSLSEGICRESLMYPIIDNLDNGAIVVECGVYLGGTTARLAKRIIKTNKNIKLYAVDIWNIDHSLETDRKIYNFYDSKQFKQTFINNMEKYNLNISILETTSIIAASSFKDKSVDFVFLDSDHTYPYVLYELLAWLPKIKIGGVIVGHDYDCSYAIKYIVQKYLIPNFPIFRSDNCYLALINNNIDLFNILNDYKDFYLDLKLLPQNI